MRGQTTEHWRGSSGSVRSSEAEKLFSKLNGALHSYSEAWEKYINRLDEQIADVEEATGKVLEDYKDSKDFVFLEQQEHGAYYAASNYEQMKENGEVEMTKLWTEYMMLKVAECHYNRGELSAGVLKNVIARTERFLKDIEAAAQKYKGS
jgi:hypothetical protein